MTGKKSGKQQQTRGKACKRLFCVAALNIWKILKGDKPMLEQNDLEQIARLLADERKAILKETMQGVAVLMENKIDPQLRLLAEGQQAVLDKLVPVSRVEELETEVKFLRAFVVQLAEKVELLQKAQ